MSNAAATTTRLEGVRFHSRPGPVSQAWSLARRKPLGAFSLLLILFMVFLSVAADWLGLRPPLQMYGQAVMKPPSAQFFMGTDNFGRDIFSRVVYGARISLTVGIGSVALGGLVGIFLGMVSAYFGGRVDMVIQRLMEAPLALPGIVFAMSIVAVLGPGIGTVIIAIAFGLAPRNNRVVRASVLKEKENLYVEAARSIGATRSRIMWRHILPNVMAPIIIIVASELGGAILVEASLSFLGVGVPPPLPSWGGMLSGPNRTYMLLAPWMAIFPGIAISLGVLAFNLFGDALRDVLDPRLRGR